MSDIRKLPSHPTLIYVTKLLHYAGYTSIAAYFVALFLIKPLLENKTNLLKNFYSFNLKSLNKLYLSLVAKYNIVPGVLVLYGDKQYNDAIIQTESSSKRYEYNYNLYAAAEKPELDPSFDKSVYVTTSRKTIEKLDDLANKLELFNDRLTKSTKSLDMANLTFQITEFNDKLQSSAVQNNRFIDKDNVTGEIGTKIRKMKGIILTH